MSEHETTALLNQQLISHFSEEDYERELERGGFLAEKNIKTKALRIRESRYGRTDTVRRRKKRGLLWAVFTFFSYVCGVLGILYALTFILILTCRQAEGALIVTAVCGVIWVSYFGRHRHPILARMLAIAAACAAGIAVSVFSCRQNVEREPGSDQSVLTKPIRVLF